MTAVEVLCAQPLDMTHGVPLGIPGNVLIGMRFAVELAIVSPPNLLPFVLGTSMLGGPRWRDVTTDVQGLTWSRGGAPGQRPLAGELQMRLLNSNQQWSPWVSPYYAPGTTLRVVLGNGVDTYSQYTGLVQTWNEGSVGLAGGSGYQWVDLVAWETLFLLSEVNNHALAGVVGGGENVDARIDRLLTSAAWQFGTDIVCSSPATFQATDLASDVATELFLTVDSTDCTVWPGKDGKLKIRDRALGAGHSWNIAHADVNPDSLVTQNDDERILSSVDLARVGGTFVHFDNVGMAGRYQRRTTQRTDLITVAEAGDADLARVAAGMLARARTTYRPISFEIQSGQDLAIMIIDSDLTDRVTLQHGLVTFSDYSICGLNHAVQVSGAGVYWITTVLLDIESNSTWSKT